MRYGDGQEPCEARVSESTGLRYDSSRPPHHSAYVWQPVLQQLARNSGIKAVLDLGCGNGSFAKQLVARGLTVHGCDISASGVAEAQIQCSGGRLFVGSGYDDLLTAVGSPVDAVVALEVVEHLYDPRRFITRVREVLRPGGVLVLSTPYHGYWKNLALALSGKLDAHFTALWDGGHIKFWSRHTLAALLKEQGFAVKHFVGVGRFPWLWKAMVVTARRP